MNRIEITPTLFATRDVWYSKGSLFKANLPQFKKDVAEIENELGLRNHRFILIAIRHKHTLGLTIPNLYESKIDPRRNYYDELLSTIIHEGIHLQQSIQGKLVWNRFESQYFWKGKPAGRVSAKWMRESKEYTTLPWEVEAFELQPIIFEKIFNRKFPQHTAKMNAFF